MNKNDAIVILTGAGISAESGLQTFRAQDGLWENYRVEDVATPEAFLRNPGLVRRFYNERRRQLKDPVIQPNAAHLALAKLENEWQGNVLLITQNVDNLHERAGSENLIHMHGELNQVLCLACDGVVEWLDDLSTDSVCPLCEAKQRLRPNIVWFGEMPLMMDEIADAISRCSLFISIGTSGNVYPAAGFVQWANQADAHTVELNLEPSRTVTQFSESRNGLASELVPVFVENLLSISK
jgi:NAD-dependent deacetylase